MEYGTNREAALEKIPGFSVTLCSPHDAMHDLLPHEIKLLLEHCLNVQLPCKYVRNAHSENPRESAYKRGGTGVVEIQKISRFGQREDGQCPSHSTIRLHASCCPNKLANNDLS